MRSAIRFLDANGRPIDGLANTETTVSSSGLNWPGLYVEAGHNEHWEADALTPDGHYVGLNVAPTRLEWEARVNGRFRKVGNDPGAFWFCPSGESFTHHVCMPSDFILVKIDTDTFRQWTGQRPVSLELRYGVASPQIDHLTRALVAEAARRSPNGRLFTDALGTALSLALVDSLGVRADPRTERVPGLPAGRLRRVQDYIESKLAADLSVDELASVALYSAAHFSRAFKLSTGISPHQYVLQRRLVKAKAMLQQGAQPVVAALSLGFTDQAHFGRSFRKAFGCTPGQIRG